VHIIYVDESGTPTISAEAPHFVVVGLSIPLQKWKEHDQQLREILTEHRLGSAEVHTAWMARRYREQERIDGFAALSEKARRDAMVVERKKELAKASLNSTALVSSLRKTFKKTEEYVHLTYDERIAVLRDLADAVGSWDDARLFGDAHRKDCLKPNELAKAREFALEQVTTRFNAYLDNVHGPGALGLMVHDQQQAESTKLNDLFRRWHAKGTTYSAIPHIAETPLFVDSSLTSMVQMADLAAYATRRFFDKAEMDLFSRLYARFDRRLDRLVGLRHYTAKTSCKCPVCKDHGRTN
jgi:hypothetical protein